MKLSSITTTAGLYGLAFAHLDRPTATSTFRLTKGQNAFTISLMAPSTTSTTTTSGKIPTSTALKSEKKRSTYITTYTTASRRPPSSYSSHMKPLNLTSSANNSSTTASTTTTSLLSIIPTVVVCDLGGPDTVSTTTSSGKIPTPIAHKSEKKRPTYKVTYTVTRLPTKPSSSTTAPSSTTRSTRPPSKTTHTHSERLLVPFPTAAATNPAPADPKFSPTEAQANAFLHKFWAVTPLLTEWKRDCAPRNETLAKAPLRCRELHNLISMAHVAEAEFNLPPLGLPKPRGWFKIIAYNLSGRPISNLPVPIPLSKPGNANKKLLVEELLKYINAEEPGNVKQLEPRESEIALVLGEEAQLSNERTITFSLPAVEEAGAGAKNSTVRTSPPAWTVQIIENL